MAAMLDDPERLLSGVPIGIADVPTGEPACQLCALNRDVYCSICDTENRTFILLPS